MFPNCSTPGCAHGPLLAPGAVSSFTLSVVWNQYPPTSVFPERVPSLMEPKMSGLQGPTSLEGPQEDKLGVNGKPLPNVVALLIAPPPMIRSPARPTSEANF